MATLQEIFTRIYEAQSIKDPRSFISLYDQNKVVIENGDISVCLPNGDSMLIQLMADYALALFGVGNYKLALSYFDKTVPLLENDLKSRNQNPFSESLYEGLVWNRGTNLYYLKKYDAASKDFKKLVNNFPENDKYLNWLQACKIAKITIIQIVIGIIAVIELFVTFIVPRGKTSLLILYISMITFAIALSFELWKYILRKKKASFPDKLG